MNKPKITVKFISPHSTGVMLECGDTTECVEVSMGLDNGRTLLEVALNDAINSVLIDHWGGEATNNRITVNKKDILHYGVSLAANIESFPYMKGDIINVRLEMMITNVDGDKVTLTPVTTKKDNQ